MTSDTLPFTYGQNCRPYQVSRLGDTLIIEAVSFGIAEETDRFMIGMARNRFQRAAETAYQTQRTGQHTIATKILTATDFADTLRLFRRHLRFLQGVEPRELRTSICNWLADSRQQKRLQLVDVSCVQKRELREYLERHIRRGWASKRRKPQPTPSANQLPLLFPQRK